MPTALRNLLLATVLACSNVSFAQGQPHETAAASAAAAEKSANAAAKSAKDAAEAAAKKAEFHWVKPNIWLLYAVPVIVFFGALFAILAIRGALKPTTWSLADALSEEILMPAFKETTDATGAKTREPIYDKEGKPVLVPEFKASSSRVIALMGLVAILLIFIGFGVFALFSFGSVGNLPDNMGEVVKFLVAGLTLFAPYLVNKFASLFQSLSGGK